MKKPKMVTRAIHGVSALIAFNQEIGSAARDLQSGLWFANPESALHNLTYNAIGLDTNNGQISSGQLQTSIVSKIAGLAFDKIAMFFAKRFRI